MNPHAQANTTITANEYPPVPSDFAALMNTPFPNPLQSALLQTLIAVTDLCYELEVTLPAHEELLVEIAYCSPILPAVISEEQEKTLLDSLRKIHKTRTMLQRLWLARRGEYYEL
jgi:hypothetical protein